MNEMILAIGLGVAGLIIGYVIATFLISGGKKRLLEESNTKADLAIQEARLNAKRLVDEAEMKAEKIVAQAEAKNESIKNRKIQEAKEKYGKLKAQFETEKAQHKIELKDREVDVVNKENELRQKQEAINAKAESFEVRESEIKAIKENLEKQMKVVTKRKEELDQSTEKIIKELETIAKLSESQARDQLIEAIRSKAEAQAMAVEKEAVANAKANAAKEAKKIVIQTIQRMCAEYTIENTVSVFNLESDDIKGQIIGREGRNIRALEAATGAEIVVDDTPEAIVISSFDPIRREICRIALKRLVADGRIHPARIEEVVAKVKKQMDEQIVEKIGRAHV